MKLLLPIVEWCWHQEPRRWPCHQEECAQGTEGSAEDGGQSQEGGQQLLPLPAPALQGEAFLESCKHCMVFSTA